MSVITKYVNSGQVGNDANSGDDPTQQPWRTIQHGVDWFRDNRQAGDTFELKLLGEFHENVVMDGPKYSDITIETWQVGYTAPGNVPQYCEARVPCGGNIATGVPIKGTVFTIKGAAMRVTLKNLAILLADHGVLVDFAPELTIDNCCIHGFGKKTRRNGAGFFVQDAYKFTMNQCYVWDNSGLNGGGGELYRCTKARLVDSAFYMNEARLKGGALALKRCTDVEVSGCIFGAPVSLPPAIEGPNHAICGGGIWISDGTTVAFRAGGPHPRPSPAPGRTRFDSNQADEYGGGLYIEDDDHVSDITLEEDTEVLNNTSEGDGGGVAVGGSERAFPFLDLDRASIHDNRAEKRGGGIWLLHAHCEVNQSDIFGNQAKRNGGGVYTEGEEEAVTCLFVSGGSVSSNSSLEDGGGAYLEHCRLLADRTTFEQNISDRNGGGLCADHADVSLSNLQVRDNTAKNFGGGVCVDQGTLTMQHCLLQRNTALNGGGLAADGGFFMTLAGKNGLDLIASTFNGNTAGTDGGALFLTNAAGGRVRLIEFESNAAGKAGGAIHVENIDLGSAARVHLEITGNNFVASAAPEGSDFLLDLCFLDGKPFTQVDAAQVSRANTFNPGPADIKVK